MRNSRNRVVIEQNCTVCGKVFWAEPREIKRGKGKTCSYSCAAKLTPNRDCSGENNNHWKGDNISPKNYSRAYREQHPERPAAHIAVRDAIRDGVLVRECCEVCGCEKAEAHHDDYSKPLEVRWLCRKHHLEHHRLARQQLIRGKK